MASAVISRVAVKIFHGIVAPIFPALKVGRESRNWSEGKTPELAIVVLFVKSLRETADFVQMEAGVEAVCLVNS